MSLRILCQTLMKRGESKRATTKGRGGNAGVHAEMGDFFGKCLISGFSPKIFKLIIIFFSFLNPFISLLNISRTGK